ncbi:DNA polymerase III subunit alpha [Rhodothermus marinus]|uniref:DNA polymerase III subunit alpha n=1 Tax=Rhodothermus marinus TaxID=29549 RepID=UPI0037C78AC0
MHRFSHLHCHTQYSLLDGAARIQTLLERAAEYEIEAVAITDHGNLFGVPEFYRTAEKIGIQPIIGCEFYLTPTSRHDRNERTRYHQVLLAKNETGYRNLIKLSSLSYLEGYYYKPRIDHELLTQYHEGLIATTCCLQGEIPQTILHKGEEAARKLFEWYLELFGEDYYIEIQDHGLPEQKKINAILLRWAREYGVRVIATNDVHYVDRTDFEPHDVLLCLQTGKDMSDPSRLRFDNDQFYLKSPAEMRQALLSDIEPRLVDEMMANTGEVADKCRFQLPTGKLLMPHYPIPPEYNGDMDAYLRDLVFEGARRRYGDPLPHEVAERLEHELAIIKKMGFAGYFLIVQDFTTAARRLGVRVGPGRGSAAGSAVAYCLGITNIDPLKYDLLFERFLNPERVSMPDIDIDFDDRGRGKVIDYVVQKYGRENVCQIITFGTMGAKMAIRDVARVLGIPLAEADRIAKLIPDGPKVTLAQAYEEVPELRALKESNDPQIRKLLHYAEVLEGSVRHTGVHAAGVIIAPGRVSDYVPVAVAKGKDNDTVTTQYDGKWIEEFGLLKMDFLGLKTLTILNDALQLIKENHGIEIDLDQIPLDDPKTFELFQRGETVAIFQFESEGMREWLRKLKPTSIDDLIAMNALYRPGPMDLIPNYIARKHGLEPVEYPHPLLEPVLKNTYGIPIYQEQVMQMAQVMAGYTLGQADLLRRCVAEGTLIVDARTGRRVPVEEVQPGMEVWSLGPDLRLHRVPVQARFDNGIQTVYKVRTRTGRTIELTAEHPLLTLQGWKHLCDLKVGDAIAVPISLATEGDLSPEPARVKLLAYLLGDGNTVHRTPRGDAPTARFFTSSPALRNDFLNAVQTLGGQVRIYKHPITGVETIYCTAPKGQANPVLTLIREVGLIGRAHEKRVPEEVFRYTQAALRLFLGRLWSTDGSIEKKRLSYCSTSMELIEDIAHLLLRLGINTIRRQRTTTHRPAFELVITDQRDIVLFARQIGPYLVGDKKKRLKALVRQALQRVRNQSIYLIPAEVGHLVRAAKVKSGLSWTHAGARVGVPGTSLSAGLNLKTPRRALSRHRTALLGRAFADETLLALSEGEVLWDPIVEITPVGRKRVYDLAVPPFANFVAQDIVVHNSMGKKKVEEMKKHREIFVAGAAERGVDAETANAVFDMMEKFAGYGFNKSHSAAYSIVAYQTAYLKANYPAEFMAAAMTSEMGDTKKLAVVLDEARRMGLELLPPSINRSQAHFTVEDGRIRFGLGAIKGVGLGAIEAILKAREKHGPFRTIFDLIRHLDLRVVNKKVLESLARAGALDELEGHRAQLVEAIDLAVQYAQKVQADRMAGQASLFGESGTRTALPPPNLPVVQPWSRARCLKEERELIGFYVTGHPLEAYRAEVNAFATTTLAELSRTLEEADMPRNGSTNGHTNGTTNGHAYRPARPRHRICGIITEVQRRIGRNGRPLAFASIEDFTGQGELVIFSSVLERVMPYLEVDAVVLVEGQVEVRGGSVKVLVDELWPMWKVRDELVEALVVQLDLEQVRPEQLDRFHALCREHAGRCKLYFDLLSPDFPGGRQRLLSRRCLVELNDTLMQQTLRLFGAEAIRLESRRLSAPVRS